MLELKNISFQVDAEGKDKEIIRNISLTIPDDKVTALVGAPVIAAVLFRRRQSEE